MITDLLQQQLLLSQFFCYSYFKRNAGEEMCSWKPKYHKLLIHNIMNTRI